MTLPHGWLVNLNKGHYRYQPPRDDPVAYSRWEFDEGRKVWERFFASRIDISGKDVLDLGCGPGGKTCYLAMLGPDRIVGVDFSADIIRQAELAMPVLIPPGERVHLEFVCVDASDLPFPDEYFDIITCSDAFEHFEKPAEVIAEAARMLKPGGLFTIDFAQWGSYNGHHLGDFFATPWLHLFWSESEIVKAVQEIITAERDRILNLKARENIDDLENRRLDQFCHGLNHLGIGRFERILSGEKRLKVKWRKRTSSRAWLYPFIYIPGLMEFAVARNVYVLARV